MSFASGTLYSYTKIKKNNLTTKHNHVVNIPCIIIYAEKVVSKVTKCLVAPPILVFRVEFKKQRGHYVLEEFMVHLMEIPMCHQWAVLLCSDRIWFLRAGSIPGPLQRLPRTDRCLFLDSYCQMQRKYSQSPWLLIVPTNLRIGFINNMSCHILKTIIFQ